MSLMDYTGASSRLLADDSLFSGATWDDIGTNKELTEFIQNRLDPDGSKYGGDLEALKRDFLNEKTRRNSSIVESVKDWATSGDEALGERQWQNLSGRLYETAPNRLFSGDSDQAWEAVKSGFAGGVVDDWTINVGLALLTGPGTGLKFLGQLGTTGLKALGGRVLGEVATKELLATGSEEALKQALIREATKRGAMRGAAIEGGIEVGLSGVGEAAQQSAEKNRGLRDELSATDALLNVGGGALLGGAIGGVGGAFAGRRMGRELAGDIPASKAQFLETVDGTPQNVDGFRARIAQEEAEAAAETERLRQETARTEAQRSVDEEIESRAIFQQTKADEIADVFDEFAALAGRSQTGKDGKYSNPTYARASNVLRMFSRGGSVVDQMRARADEAAQAGKIEEAARLDGVAASAQRAWRWVDSADMEHIEKLSEIPDDIMDALGNIDAELNSLIRNDRFPTGSAPTGAGTRAAAATPADGARAAPSAPGATGVATSAPTGVAPGGAPAATPVHGAPSPAPSQAAGAQAQAEVDAAAAAEQAAARTETAAADAAANAEKPQTERIESYVEQFNDDQKAALETLQKTIDPAGMTVDGIIARLDNKESRGSIIGEIVEKTGAPAADVEKAFNTVTGGVTKVRRARRKAAEAQGQAPADQPAATQPQGTETPAGQQATASPEATAAEAPAGEAPAADAAPAPIGDRLAQAEAEAFSFLVERVEAAATRDVELEVAKLGDLTPEKLVELQADPTTGPLWSKVNASMLQDDVGREHARVVMRRAADEVATQILADAVTPVMPDALNVTHFDQLLSAMPGISEVRRRKYVENYKSMVRHALAGEVGRLGSVESVVAKYGDRVTELLGDLPRTEFARKDQKVRLGEIIKRHEHVLDDAQGKQLGKLLRDFHALLQGTPMAQFPEFMESALIKRANTLVGEILLGSHDWRVRNPDAAAMVDAMQIRSNIRRADRDRITLEHPELADAVAEMVAQYGSGVEIVDLNSLGGRTPIGNALFKNPVVQRLVPGSEFAAIVHGRSLGSAVKRDEVKGRKTFGNDALRNVQSVAQSTYGFGYFGTLFSNPSMLVRAVNSARLEILQAAVDSAPNRAISAKAAKETFGIDTGGKPLTQKEVKGMFAEQANARVQAVRHSNIFRAVEELEAGTIAREDFDARMAEVGTQTSIPVSADEIAIMRDFINVRDALENARKVHEAEMADVFTRLQRDGIDQSEVISAIMDGYTAAVSKAKGNLLRVVDRYGKQADKAISKQQAADARAAKKLRAKQERKMRGRVADDATSGGAGAVPGSNLDRGELFQSVAFKDKDGNTHEFRPFDVLDIDEATGEIKLLGKVIGRTTAQAENGSRTVELDMPNGKKLQLSDVVDEENLAKRKSFLSRFGDQIVSSGQSTKAKDAVHAAGIEGELPPGASRLADEEKAVTELKGGMLTPEQMSTPFTTLQQPPQGHRWAIRTGDGSVWKVHDKHATPADVIGTHADRGPFQLGIVPSSRVEAGKATPAFSKQNDSWLRSAFTPYGREPGKISDADASVIARVEADKTAAPEILLARKGPIPYADTAKIKTSSGLSLFDMVNDFDRAVALLDWDTIRDRASLDEMVRRFESMSREIEALAPNGVLYPNGTRRTAFTFARKHMASFSGEEVDAAIEALRRLDVTGRGFPYLEASPEAGRNAYAPNALTLEKGGRKIDYKENAIHLATRRVGGDLSAVVPAHVTLVHEIGHWAFRNLLSPTEKVAFIRFLGKFYDADGKFSPALLRKEIPYLKEVEKLGITFKGIDSGTNEVFAHLFSSYYLQKIRGADVADEAGIWQRVVHYAKNLLSALRKRPVDADLIPLFERIMPSSPLESRYSRTHLRNTKTGDIVAATNPVDDQHRSAAQWLDAINKLDDHRGNLDAHLFGVAQGGDAGLINDLDAAARYLYGYLYGGKRGEMSNAVRDSIIGRGVTGADAAKSLINETGIGRLMALLTDVKDGQAQVRKHLSTAFEESTGGGNVAIAVASWRDTPEALAVFAEHRKEMLETLLKQPNVTRELAESTAEWGALQRVLREFPDLDTAGMEFIGGADGAGTVRITTDLQRRTLLSMAGELRDMLTDGQDALSAKMKGYQPLRSNRSVKEAAAVEPAVGRKVSEEVDKIVAETTKPAAAKKGGMELVDLAKAAHESGDAVAFDSILTQFRTRKRGQKATDPGTKHLEGVESVEELEKELRIALQDGDVEFAAEARYRLWQMGKKPAGKRTSKRAKEAAAKEAKENLGSIEVTEMPPLADPAEKAVASRITSRDKEQEAVQKVIFNKLLNVSSLDATEGGIARLMGMKLPDGADPENFVTAGPVFDALRNKIRLVARGLMDGDAKAEREIAELLINGTEVGQSMRPLPDIVLAARRAASGFGTDADFRLLKSIAPEMYVAASDIADDLKFVLGGLADDAGLLDMSAGVYAPSYPTGLHPAIAGRRVDAAVNSLDEHGLFHLGEQIGLSKAESTADRIRSSVVFYQPGRRSLEDKPLTQGAKLRVKPLDSLDLQAVTRGADEGRMKRVQAAGQIVEREDEIIASPDSTPEQVRTAMYRREAALRVMSEGTRDISDLAQPYMIDTGKLYTMGTTEQRVGLAAVARSFADATDSPDAASQLFDMAMNGDAAGIYRIVRDSIGEERAQEILSAAGYIGVRDGDEIVLFNPESAIRLSDALPTERPRNPDEMVRQPLAGEVLLGLAHGGEKVDSLGLQLRALSSAGEAAAKAISFMTPGKAKDITPDDAKRIGRLVGVQIRENSARLRRWGANWLADQIKKKEGTGLYEARDALIGKHLLPSIDAINAATRGTGYINDFIGEIKRNGRLTKAQVRKSGESKIGRAMREGASAVSKLNAEERNAVRVIDRMFQNLLKEQREVGVEIGDIRGNGNDFYIPQRFDREWLISNSDAAIDKLSKWLSDVEGHDAVEARERASRIIHRAIDDEEGAGFLDVGKARYSGGDVFGSVAYQRVLRISSAEMERYGLADLFDNDIRSLVVGYSQAAATRIEMVKRFGVRSHAFNAYMGIAEGGADQAARLLMRGEVGTTIGVTQDIPNVSVKGVSDLTKPLVRGEQEAVEIVSNVLRILNTPGDKVASKLAAEQYLTGLYASRGLPGEEHFAKKAEAIVNGLADFGVDGANVDTHEIRVAQQMMATFSGRPPWTTGSTGLTTTPGARKFSSFMSAFNSVTLLSMATIASLPDAALSLVRSGNAGAYIRGMAKAAKGAAGYDPAYRNALRNTAVSIESILNENLTNVHGGVAGRMTNLFFLANGLTLWTKAMRQASASVGFETIKANQIIAKRERQAGRVGGAKYRQSVRFLRQLGLADLVNESTLTDLPSASGNDRITQALHRFANETTFQPNKNDIPLWAQDPIGKLFFQFKSFPMMMGRMVKRAGVEAYNANFGTKDGSYKPLLYLATVGVAAGAGTQALRDKLQGRNEEDEWLGMHSVRPRIASQMFGEFFGDKEMVDGLDNEALDHILGWYATGVAGLGAMGLVADMMFNSAAQADNGAYGRERITSLIFGPTMGTFQDMLAVTAGALDNDEESNADERTAVRKVLKRIPGAGSIRSWNEDWTDAIAGEGSR